MLFEGLDREGPKFGTLTFFCWGRVILAWKKLHCKTLQSSLTGFNIFTVTLIDSVIFKGNLLLSHLRNEFHVCYCKSNLLIFLLTTETM